MARKGPLKRGQNKNQQFNRLKRTLLEKANEFSLLCEADVYFAISHKGKYYTYISNPKWRPSDEEIVRVQFRAGE
jgi:hypothetical protein